MKVAFYTLGCKVNQYETGCMEKEFLDHGFEVVSFSEMADIYVINTCSVTAESDKKSRHMIRRAKKNNEEAIVAVCGCFAEKDKGESAAENGADIIIGSSGKSELFLRVQDYLADKSSYRFSERIKDQKQIEPMTSGGVSEKTRASIKVEDGCDNFCAYCIIPYVRGRVRSKPVDDVLTEAKGLVDKGFSEIVVTGIHLSSYGKDLKDVTLTELIEEISKIKGLQRIRLGSLEPTYITEETVRRLSRLPSLCPHFHLSLQSGCDRTLLAMKRKYTADEYRKSVQLLRRFFEDAAITTDILTGFPGETEGDFSESLAFFKEIGFAEAHIFPYSVREGTAAATYENQVPEHVKIKRSKLLSAAGKESREGFLASQLSKTEEVIFEMKPKDGKYFGYTKNYTPVFVESQQSLSGQLRSVLLTEVIDGFCTGVLIE